MPIYLGEKLCKLFRGNYGPASIYKGARKIAGYTEKTKTGSDITFNNSYNDYAKIKASGNTVTEFEPIATTPPTFTRSSTAYKSDGSVVNAGVPRIEADKGVLVEEGTTNLINYTSLILDNGSASTKVNVTNGIELSEKEIFWYTEFDNKFGVTPSTLYILSFLRNVILQSDKQVCETLLFYDSSNIFLGEIGTSLTYTDGIRTLSFTTPAGCAYVKLRLMRKQAVASSLCAYRYTNIQLEAKPYPTSFHPTTRSAESLTIPASAIPKEGTIRFDVTLPVNFTAYTEPVRLFESFRGVSGTNHGFAVWHEVSKWWLGVWDDNNVQYVASIADTGYTSGKLRFAVRYSASELALFIQGNKLATKTNPVFPALLQQMFWGSQGGTFRFANGIFANIHYSSKLYSDEQLANTGALTVDEYTTYFAPLTSDLSATKRHWTVYDSSGTLTVSDNASQSQEFTLPTLRKIGSVANEYDLGTGVLTKRISDWITLDGSLDWGANAGLGLTGKRNMYTPPNYPSSNNASLTYKYDSAEIGGYNNIGYVDDYGMALSVQSRLYISANMYDTGWCNSFTPSGSEIKAYFYGWQMCNADGTSPYYKSEVPYTPSTWEEWSNNSGTYTFASSGVTFYDDGVTFSAIKMTTAIKPSAKYGLLYNVVSNTATGDLIVSGSGAFSSAAAPKTVGNNKLILNSKATITTNTFIFGLFYKMAGNSITVKDIRVFELPTGSQIEADFTNLTADELSAKYTFNGLCTKNWRKITDLTGLTSVLPTASYEGYTPYKMIYQLATPVTENLGVNTVPTYYPTTSVTTEQTNVAVSTIEVTAKEMDL
ncbi:hypothetical protein [Bacteroides sp.]|uniref:hypothetical protein n=1 Tax=Bacteroides sp. TaxID=29523 RepID=UPI002626968E|nr:hypothetical protein [Bacteroides sp.]MDD3039748.1 hypothetical protein [Bacteroides sp.]